jgi:ATP-dependent DNA helicase
MAEVDGVSDAMQKEEEQLRKNREKEDARQEAKFEEERRKDAEGGQQFLDSKFKALEYLLNQSKVNQLNPSLRYWWLILEQLYSTIMLAQMQREEEQDEAKDERAQKKAQKREEKAEKMAEASQRRATRSAANVAEKGPKEEEEEEMIDELAAPSTPSKHLAIRGRGKPAKAATKNNKGKISDFFKKEDVKTKAGEGNVKDAIQEAVESDVKTSDVGIQDLKSARQPALVTGGTMRKYQLEGLEWLENLYHNGLNGILADEMGLGKTIQTIAFLAYLRENEQYGPYLIAAPLSTTSNWVDEFQKWTPSIPVVLYHGDKKEREKLRRTRLRRPGNEDFPVVVTSYEICMNDRKFLANYGWKFIIIDEGHRIKNLNCRLIRELQSYQSANRLLITGTPLQNNLAELWSLLHFLMPQIFDKLEAFESWFDFSGLKDKNAYDNLLSEERQRTLVASLHAILKPFLLRRVKADVESMMPRKREYVLFAPLTPMQRELYQAVLDGTSRAYLEGKAVERITGSGTATPRSASSVSSLKRKAMDDSRGTTPNKSARTSRETTPATNGRSRRNKARKSYEEVSDRQYFKDLEADRDASSNVSEDSLDEDEQIRAENLALAKRQIGSKKLQNPVMQLRLCCNSPYNFFNPFLATATIDEEIIPDETLITTSGKMMLLDSLLSELFRRGHKVLIFSQFKTQLDLLELYATSLRGWNVCRIDGSVPQAERQAQIKAFNKPSKPKPQTNGRSKKRTSKTNNSGDDQSDDEPCNLFLLSTRAGGQGINLAAADTVILYDSDWNPQQDLQAQDRAHRIGQTRNVIVYRLATRNTVEQSLLESANTKRRLEKLVIRKGGLTQSSRSKMEREQREEMEELQQLLRREDGEKWDVVDEHGRKGGLLGKRQLEILLDRSEEAYDRAEKGLDAGGEGEIFSMIEQKGDGALLEGLRA